MCNCPTEEEMFRSIDRCIDERRWKLIGVGYGNPPSPVPWTYTIGLAEGFAHPELFTVGACCSTCSGSLLHAVGELVAAGGRFDEPSQDPIVVHDRGEDVEVHVRRVEGPPARRRLVRHVAPVLRLQAVRLAAAHRHAGDPPGSTRSLPMGARLRSGGRGAATGARAATVVEPRVAPSSEVPPMSRQRIVLPTVEPPAVLDDSWWMPLILFFSRLKDERSCDLWLPDWDWRQFMVMHGVERRPRPFLVVYKHVDTRREVNVDRSGWAYRYRAVGELGRFDRHKRLHDAFWQLDPRGSGRARGSRSGSGRTGSPTRRRTGSPHRTRRPVRTTRGSPNRGRASRGSPASRWCPMPNRRSRSSGYPHPSHVGVAELADAHG